MDNEQDFFKNHDKKLNTELVKFYAVANGKLNTDKEITDLRDSVVDASQDYKNATLELRDFVTEKIGFEPVKPGEKELTSAEIEQATVAKMLNSIDALMYKDMLENQGRGYEELMDRRDTFTNSQNVFDKVFNGLTDKVDELELANRLEHDNSGKFENLLEAIDKSGNEVTLAEIER